MTARSPKLQAQLDAATTLLDLCLLEVTEAGEREEERGYAALHLAFRRVAGVHGLRCQAAGIKGAEVAGMMVGVASVGATFAGESLSHLPVDIRVAIAPDIVNRLIVASGGRTEIVDPAQPRPGSVH